ncbi:unnamed protein product [Paramecium octaurelia]|uniref:Uncharacterized protein n=1 Tax=Paramecium octaurelia TaxID=43137 RepID=A0A8S1VMY7_PAROT|nr:unnamed protein product [Paramecium octaurelia]
MDPYQLKWRYHSISNSYLDYQNDKQCKIGCDQILNYSFN